jgi:hypothetical protein
MGNRNNSSQRENLIENNEQQDGLISLLVNSDQLQVKKIFAIKNPVYLKRSTLVLDRDSSNRNNYYIGFIYDAAVNFNMNIYQNAKKTNLKSKISDSKLLADSSDYNYYKPNEVFPKISVNNLPRGQNIKFFDPSIYIDVAYFNQNKVSDTTEEMYDIVIEFIPIFEDDINPNTTSNTEIIFYSLCRILNEENQTVKIKCESQKLKTNGIWLEIHEVYHSALENNECLICCHNLRNTVFLPCKHSCTCQTCAHSLRMRNNPCPICKNSIDDLVIIETEE